METIFHAWTGVFMSRFWRVWIDKKEKIELDKLSFELTQRRNVSQGASRTNTQQYSMTIPSIFSLELNAHCLVYLALLVAAGTLLEEVLSIDRFHSQTCEGFFETPEHSHPTPHVVSISQSFNFSIFRTSYLISKLSKIKTNS